MFLKTLETFLDDYDKCLLLVSALASLVVSATASIVAIWFSYNQTRQRLTAYAGLSVPDNQLIVEVSNIGTVDVTFYKPQCLLFSALFSKKAFSRTVTEIDAESPSGHEISILPGRSRRFLIAADTDGLEEIDLFEGFMMNVIPNIRFKYLKMHLVTSRGSRIKVNCRGSLTRLLSWERQCIYHCMRSDLKRHIPLLRFL